VSASLLPAAPRAVVRFAGLLRRHGLPVTLGEVTDAARALGHLDLSDRHEVFLGLRAVLVSRVEEIPTFERCFNAFWRAAPADDPQVAACVAVARAWLAGPDKGAPDPELASAAVAARTSIMRRTITDAATGRSPNSCTMKAKRDEGMPVASVVLAVCGALLFAASASCPRPWRNK